ncbi:MAG: class I SAM-dependent methyltransferase [Myxococcales bacterium]|nr:class I SAM-dependent methyltransferase [Myxococcales bacterium]
MKSFLRRIARESVFATLDLFDTITGRRDPLTPPRRLMTVGSNSRFRNDFTEIGEQLFSMLVEIGGLKPHHRVLDVGCGVGRLAIPLTRYLTTSYDGFDIVKPSIEYCQRVITRRHPNFRFRLVQLHNTHYTPEVENRPYDFQFPYPDGSFDFVLLTSVFTHMQYRELQTYHREIARVLAPGGVCFATYFLLDEDTDRKIASGQTKLTFQFPMDHGRAEIEGNPDAAFAFNTEFVRADLAACGVQVFREARGHWRGNTPVLNYQDILVFGRPV